MMITLFTLEIVLLQLLLFGLQVPQSGVSGFLYMYVGPALLILLTGLAGLAVKRLGTVHTLVNSALNFQKALVSAVTMDNQVLRAQMAAHGLTPLLDPVITIPVGPNVEKVQIQTKTLEKVARPEDEPKV